MAYDRKLIAGKLLRWENYMKDYKLPDWNEIPDLGLYMEQVIDYIKTYLDYIPPELDYDLSLTPSTINNYVRKKIMPIPINKRYYRVHLVFLLMILTMKQSINISSISKLIPVDMASEDLKRKYSAYRKEHEKMTKLFVREIRIDAEPILNEQKNEKNVAFKTEDLIFGNIIIGGYTKLLAERLLLLEGKDVSNGGSIEIRQRNS